MKQLLVLSGVLTLTVLLAPPAARAENDAENEQEMEELAEETKREAEEALQRKQEREAAAAAEAVTSEPDGVIQDTEESAPAPAEVAPASETPREKRLRSREEIRAEREQIKLERLREKERIRAEKLRIREDRRAEKLRIREDRRAEKERIREERRAEKERRRAERELIREERRAEKEQIRAERRAKKEQVRAERRAASVAYWATHTRPRFYVNGMLVGGALFEDSGNRWTGRDSETLETVGGIFRAGGVIDDQHLLGARMQLMVRPSQSVLGEGATEDSWGMVGNLFIGPEYRYITSFGLYLGASVGLAATWSEADLEYRDECRGWDNDCDDWDHDEYDGRTALSAGAIGTLGYEFRISRWFAMNVEAFGGYYHGLDQDELTVNNAVFGLAIGMGI